MATSSSDDAAFTPADPTGLRRFSPRDDHLRRLTAGWTVWPGAYVLPQAGWRRATTVPTCVLGPPGCRASHCLGSASAVSRLAKPRTQDGSDRPRSSRHRSSRRGPRPAPESPGPRWVASGSTSRQTTHDTVCQNGCSWGDLGRSSPLAGRELLQPTRLAHQVGVDAQPGLGCLYRHPPVQVGPQP